MGFSITVFIVILIAITVLPQSFKDQGDENKGIPVHGEFGYHFKIEDSGITLQWRKSKDNVFDMSMSSQQDGYVAVGFCDPMTRFSREGMENCDIVLGWIENTSGTPRIADLFSASEGILSIDKQVDYLLRPGSKQDVNFTLIKFKRKVDTKDPQDVALRRPVIIIWAWNENDPIWNTEKNEVKLGTIIKHRSAEGLVYQTESRGHTPITVKMDNAMAHHGGSSDIVSFPYLLVLLVGVGIILAA